MPNERIVEAVAERVLELGRLDDPSFVEIAKIALGTSRATLAGLPRVEAGQRAPEDASATRKIRIRRWRVSLEQMRHTLPDGTRREAQIGPQSCPFSYQILKALTEEVEHSPLGLGDQRGFLKDAILYYVSIGRPRIARPLLEEMSLSRNRGRVGRAVRLNFGDHMLARVISEEAEREGSKRYEVASAVYKMFFDHLKTI